MSLTVFKNSSAAGGDLMLRCDSVSKWFLPSLADVFAAIASESVLHTPAVADNISPDRLFRGAIFALELLLLELMGQKNAADEALPLVLSGPVPILRHPDVVSRLFAQRPAASVWAFSGDPLNPYVWLLDKPSFFPMLPLSDRQRPQTQIVPLLLDDPLTNEHFCVCLTEKFSLVFGVHQELGFQFSFDPEVVSEAWRVLRPRVLLTSGQERLKLLDAAFDKVRPVEPSYKIVMRFSQLLLKNLPEINDISPARKSCVHLLPASIEGESLEPTFNSGVKVNDNIKIESKPKKHLSSYFLNHFSSLRDGARTGNEKQLKPEKPAQDVELLQAIFHEVRTPLSTIRTLTRLLLKRHNLDEDVIKRLQMIDRECTEQIDRFNLIFKAVEIETSEFKRTPVQLTSTSLADVFSGCIPRWQKQAARRNLTLDVILPQKMPPVVSDPTMLEQVLTGAIENFTATIPTSAHVRVVVTLAGDQLKVQLQSEVSGDESQQSYISPLKSLGQLLMFQPETGNLSLNLDVTKNLFHALGAKLIVRQKPQQGEVLTIFLPLE